MEVIGKGGGWELFVSILFYDRPVVSHVRPIDIDTAWRSTPSRPSEVTKTEENNSISTSPPIVVQSGLVRLDVDKTRSQDGNEQLVCNLLLLHPLSPSMRLCYCRPLASSSSISVNSRQRDK